MLTDVTIEGLRGVGRVELCFAPDQRVHVLFGANGVGKTKCLEALYQFLLASNNDFFSAVKHGFSIVEGHLILTTNNAFPSAGWHNEDPWPVMARICGVEFDRINFTDKTAKLPWHDLPVVFLGAGRRASLSYKENVQSSLALGKFADRREKYFRDIVDALQQNDLRGLGMSGDTHDWFIKRAQSGNRHQESQDNREVEIEAVLSMLHTIEPRIDPDPETLRIDGGNHVFLKVDGEKRELGELSSGFAALLKMIQAIVAGYAAFTNEVQLQNVRGIVLIDEIDAHLHVRWQTCIISCLKRLLPNTTFYIATHSPLVLTQLKDGEAYSLKRGQDGVVRSQIIKGANRRIFDDVLEDALGVNLNKLKLELMEDDDQTEAKQKLLSLLRAQKKVKA